MRCLAIAIGVQCEIEVLNKKSGIRKFEILDFRSEISNGGEDRTRTCKRFPAVVFKTTALPIRLPLRAECGAGKGYRNNPRVTTEPPTGSHRVDTRPLGSVPGSRQIRYWGSIVNRRARTLLYSHVSARREKKSRPSLSGRHPARRIELLSIPKEACRSPNRDSKICPSRWTASGSARRGRSQNKPEIRC
jgi:hypothetical protein